jgi:dihydroflavonol-4-reductase
MKKVLLTGASGYIGKHIALELINQGYEVRASVRTLARAQEVRDAVAPYVTPGIDLTKKLTFVELDLEKDAGWDAALNGMDVLMHTASPFPIASPKNEDDLIRPAVQGTLRALSAAKDAGIKRVILTSSVAAIYGHSLPSDETAFDESMWTDVDLPIGKVAYTKSKTLAEKAAWDYVKKSAGDIQLTTINPVLVLGAPLDNNFGSSISVVQRILQGKDPLLPDLRFGIVDVRDVARMHVQSIENKATYGERIIACAETLSFIEIAKILKSAYPKSKTKTGKAPTFLIKFLSNFDGDIKAILPLLGKAMILNNTKAVTAYGMKFISAEVSVKESAAYLFKSSAIKG